jgi:F-type H+-transporting ATPase subunit epsilon
VRLRVCLPDRVLVDSRVKKIIAESEDGSFCLLPRHIDYVALLVPGILSYESDEVANEEYLAVDEGILIKRGDDVTVSTRKGVLSKDLEVLKQTVENEFLELEEQERKARSIIAKLEMDVVQGILGLRS